ncbi:hypothetical protein [Dehalogenimonas sp. 4OHTPN]|uniref:Phage tail protein n=1 Tax=Dehalogenimonas sp. 4OHTPN TaxID=3166643 RepID=A0AAU8GCX7_9CHLR
MRELSPSLLAAQASPSRQGIVSIVLRKRRPAWQTLYSGAEPDYFHAATLAGDGSRIRARLGPAADSRRLYRQRIVTPDESSDFSQWTYANEYNAVAVACAALSAEVSICWIKSDRSIRRIKSVNYGAIFGAPELIDYSPTTACGGIAAAYKPNGDLALFFADQSALYVKKRVNGAWQAKAAWNKSTGALSGVACVYDGDWNLVLTGRDSSGNFRLWSLVCGDGGALPAGAWGELIELAASPAAEGFEFRAAFLDRDDVYRCAYVEKFTGAEACSRVYMTAAAPGAAFDSGLWTEPEPLEITGDYGVTIVHSAGALWLSSANSVRRAVFNNAETDLIASAAGVSLDLAETEGKAVIELDNSALGPPPAAPGDEIQVSPGYITESGAETGGSLSFTVRRVERRGGKIIIEASDGWQALKDWRSRNLLRWNASASTHSVRDIIAWLAVRCGLRLETISASSSLTSLYPDFCLSPGADALSAVRRLLSFVPDRLFVEAGIIYLKHPVEDEAAVYGYGLDHQIAACRAAEAAIEFNHLRLAGAGGLVVEAFDWPSLVSSGARSRSRYDRGLVTAPSLHDWADALLREASAAASGCEITVPPNCGQQLYDVVEVTDEATGLSAARYRVVAIELDYQAMSGKYEMKLKLSGV